MVETNTGISVRVVKDPNLISLASVQVARKGSLPMHLVRYKPIHGEPPDYLICFQCVYILRLFSNAPENRYDLISSINGQKEVNELLRKSDLFSASNHSLNNNHLSVMTSQLLNGILIHLRSIPVGLRVSEWLSSNFQELKSEEIIHVQRELDNNRLTLEPEIKKSIPSRVFNATQAISSAYSLYWSIKYDTPSKFNIYKLEGFKSDARSLLDISENIPIDPNFDRVLIDAWAKYLNLTDWYSWNQYQSPLEG